MRDIDAVRALLGPADPATATQVAPQIAAGDLIDRAEAVDVELPDTGPAAPRPPRRRWHAGPKLAFAATLTLVLALAGGAVLYQGGGGTPPAAAPSDREQILAFAAGLAEAPYESQPGDYTYVRTKGAYFQSFADAGSQPSPPLRWDYEEEHWQTDAGTGRTHYVRRDWSFPDDTSKQYYAEHPDELKEQTKGTGGGSWGESHGWGIGDGPRLPTDTRTLARLLFETDIATLPGEALPSLERAYGNRCPSREVRAAILRILADVDGIGYVGAATDPEGRPGIGIAREGFMAIFDKHTGDLLATGRHRAGESALDTSKPHTISLERRRVTTMPQR